MSYQVPNGQQYQPQYQSPPPQESKPSCMTILIVSLAIIWGSMIIHDIVIENRGSSGGSESSGGLYGGGSNFYIPPTPMNYSPSYQSPAPYMPSGVSPQPAPRTERRNETLDPRPLPYPLGPVPEYAKSKYCVFSGRNYFPKFFFYDDDDTKHRILHFRLVGIVRQVEYNNAVLVTIRYALLNCPKNSLLFDEQLVGFRGDMSIFKIAVTYNINRRSAIPDNDCIGPVNPPDPFFLKPADVALCDVTYMLHHGITNIRAWLDVPSYEYNVMAGTGDDIASLHPQCCQLLRLMR